jgi:hypothetical protein
MCNRIFNQFFLLIMMVVIAVNSQSETTEMITTPEIESPTSTEGSTQVKEESSMITEGSPMTTEGGLTTQGSGLSNATNSTDDDTEWMRMNITSNITSQLGKIKDQVYDDILADPVRSSSTTVALCLQTLMFILVSTITQSAMFH